MMEKEGKRDATLAQLRAQELNFTAAVVQARAQVLNRAAQMLPKFYSRIPNPEYRIPNTEYRNLRHSRTEGAAESLN